MFYKIDQWVGGIDETYGGGRRL